LQRLIKFVTHDFKKREGGRTFSDAIASFVNCEEKPVGVNRR
jgi:hypothetical protein